MTDDLHPAFPNDGPERCEAIAPWTRDYPPAASMRCDLRRGHSGKHRHVYPEPPDPEWGADRRCPGPTCERPRRTANAHESGPRHAAFGASDAAPAKTQLRHVAAVCGARPR